MEISFEVEIFPLFSFLQNKITCLSLSLGVQNRKDEEKLSFHKFSVLKWT